MIRHSKYAGTQLIAQGGILDYDPNFLPLHEADQWFEFLMKNVSWKQNYYSDFRTGEKLPIPRMTAWYADDTSMAYTYSGITEQVQPWIPELLSLKEKIEKTTGAEYNSVLLNLYRTGKDSVGMHADDEVELGNNPNIASISLGEVREFKLTHNESGASYCFDLEPGSLLVMSGTTQHYWKHGVPKQPKLTNPRINLTFRKFFKV